MIHESCHLKNTSYIYGAYSFGQLLKTVKLVEDKSLLNLHCRLCKLDYKKLHVI